MEENLNIFGKNQGEIGSLDKNLVLRTKGQVYIRFGRKYIELLDNKGNLNVKIPKFIFKVNSESEMKSNGIYLLDDNVYVYYDGDIIQLTGTESEFVSYAIEQNLTQEQINIAQNNIGLTFNSIDEALQTINEGIFFVGDSIYYTKDGEYIELTFTLNYPLKDINEAELTRYPQGNYQTIVFINGRWVYSSIVTKEEFNSLDFDFTLNTPLQEINNASELQTLPDKQKEEETPSEEPSGDDTPSGESTGDDIPSEEDPDYKNMPWAIVYKGNDAWAYEKVVPYEFFKKCCDEVKAEIEELKDKTKTFIVTWLNKDGTEFATTTVQNGQSASLPNGQPDVKHWDFDKWDYNNEPITEDISINSEWKYVPPKIFIECNPSSVESTGGEVLVSYWVEWDGDLILEDITVEGSSSNIDYSIDEEIITDNNKITRKINITESTYSSLGKIYFKASFMGEEGTEEGMGIVTTETMLIQKSNGTVKLDMFDIMKFTIDWTDMVDSVPEIDEYWYGKKEGVDWEWRKEQREERRIDVLYEKINNEWVESEQTIAWKLNNGKYQEMHRSDTESLWMTIVMDLDTYTYTEGTKIQITDKNTLDEYGFGYGGNSFTNKINTYKQHKIIVRKKYTQVFDPDDIELSQPEDVLLANQYLVWSGDNQSPGGEFTIINFNKIKENFIRQGQKYLYIYIKAKWYQKRYPITKNFSVVYSLYNLKNEEEGFISDHDVLDFVPENEESIETISESDVLQCHTDANGWTYNKEEFDNMDPSATLQYDLDTGEIYFYPEYISENPINPDSTFIWTEPKSNPEPSSEEEQNDNN